MSTRPPPILGPDGRPARSGPGPGPRPPAPGRPGFGASVAARYDAATLSDESRNHWAHADHYSARSANAPEIRRILRNRARYESANNSYCRGMLRTLANDTVGTGPRLQLQGPPEAAEALARVEDAFGCWADRIQLADKLATMVQSRACDGEAFGLLVTNPRLADSGPGAVLLDLKLIEAEQVATPFPYPLDDHATDGLRFDDADDPTEYHVLRHHPGDMYIWGFPYDFDRVPPKFVAHWFKRERPHQFRGVPEITPALPLYALLRRYTLATVTAAETAALFAALLKTTAPADADGGPPEAVDAFDTQEIVRGMMTALPEGYDVTQLKPEQPTTTYPQFKHEILNEIARCLNMPFNVAAGNSAGYNYSSGRLDHQVYYKSLRVDQSRAERVVLSPLLDAWLAEARLADPALVAGLPPGPPCRQWFWDGFEHVDPEKEANAERTRLDGRTTSYARVYARQGRDWEAEFAQIARERDAMAALGIEPADAAFQPPQPPKPPKPPKPDPPGADHEPPTNTTD